MCWKDSQQQDTQRKGRKRLRRPDKCSRPDKSEETETVWAHLQDRKVIDLVEAEQEDGLMT